MMGDNNSGSYPNIVISPFTHLQRLERRSTYATSLSNERRGIGRTRS